jgi:CBS-domain-containing membrane protein
MGRVADILRDKGMSVVTIEVGASALEAARAMVDRNIGAILVTDGETIAGILSERDLLRHFAAGGGPLDETFVADVMVSPVIGVGLETSIDECMALVTEQRIRHLPVMDEGTLVGIVSIGDLVKFESDEQHVRIRYLTEYITAR